MQCPICKTEMMISSTSTAVDGDKSPDTPTKIYTVQQLSCRNKQCENFGKVVQEVRTKIFDATAQETTDG